MKITILITAFSFLLFNSTENFIITEANKLEWSKVYETELSTEDLHEAIKIQLKAEEISENTFFVSIKNYQLDYKSLGYTTLNAPIAIQGKINFDLFIKTKEGKYKATVKEIKSITPPDYLPFDMELLAIKKGKYRKFFINHLSKSLEYNLTKKTTLVAEDDDW